MRVVFFSHSFVSCWNHGNVHFLRGVARELLALGHQVVVYEPKDGWSRRNAAREPGATVLDQAAQVVPGVDIRLYGADHFDLDRALDRAEVVVVHEWNDPALVARLGERRLRGGRFTLLFHDTHHRAVTAPEEIGRFELDGYDAVLAFGEVLSEVYRRRGWGRQVFTWHEAADTALFRPDPLTPKDTDLIWVGNWGDGERDEELRRMLLQPVARLRLAARVHGVRYPAQVTAELARDGLTYAGWLPNHRVPAAFARARMTVHIPRRPYAQALPGIPTIRVFEALACGLPLVSARWHDAEGLFPDGSFLMVDSGDEMTAAMDLLLRDPDFAGELARCGWQAVRARHTCAHRVAELIAILDEIGMRRAPDQLAPLQAGQVEAP
jgi:spore maturation protein CgeB